jgi:hypothetical protein
VRLKRSHVDAGERVTKVLARRSPGEQSRSYRPSAIEVVPAHETAAELQAPADERERVLLAVQARIERHGTSAAGVEPDGRRRE